MKFSPLVVIPFLLCALSACGLLGKTDDKSATALYLHREVTDAKGRHWLVDGANQALLIPGSGPASKIFAEFRNVSHRWYIDRHDHQVDLPPLNKQKTVLVYSVFPRFRDFKEDPLPLNQPIRWNKDGQPWVFCEGGTQMIISDGDAWGQWLASCHAPEKWIHQSTALPSQTTPEKAPAPSARR